MRDEEGCGDSGLFCIYDENMSNLTSKDAASIHGRNPQNLIETTIKYRIWDSLYWKEHCFALTAESVIDKACDLKYIGGTYANTRPTEFLCLTLKLLQLQPQREILLEYLRADEFKYLRALAMFYIRLTFPPLDVFEILEPLLEDYRKLRFRSMDGSYSILTIDEYADQLLNEERVCDIQLPRLTQRRILEEVEGLGKRRSKLGLAIGMGADSDEESEGYQSDDVQGRGHTDSEEEDDDGVEGDQRYISRSPTPASDDDQPSRPRFVSRSPSPAEEEDSGRYVSRSPTPEQD